MKLPSAYLLFLCPLLYCIRSRLCSSGAYMFTLPQVISRS